MTPAHAAWWLGGTRSLSSVLRGLGGREGRDCVRGVPTHHAALGQDERHSDEHGDTSS